MNRGYRLNNVHAYANYYADISNVADFNFIGNAARGVRNLGGRVGRGVMGAAGRVGSTVGNLRDRTMFDLGRLRGNLDRKAVRLGTVFHPALGRDKIRQIMNETGMSASELSRQLYGRRRLTGYTVGGLGVLTAGGAVGAGGYAGYRALKNRWQPQEEEMMEQA